MQCYSELTPPTAVTHSLTLPFVSTDSNNLVVAKTSLLQIFTTKSFSGELDSTATRRKSPDPDNALDRNPRDERVSDGPRRSDLASKTKLVLIAEYTLSGTITSLVRIKTKNSKSGGESLLVSFKDAKLSLVEWDPARPGVSTVSIHLYEQDDHKDIPRAPWADNLGDQVNYLLVDPSSRCAALKFGARSLAILPFKQSDEDIAMADDHDEELDGPRLAAPVKMINGVTDKNDTPYGSSFVIQLTTISPRLIFPIHLAFLYEYREPTFGILSSTISPSASLLHERKDCVNYQVFNMDLVERDSTMILSVEYLPYDLSKVIPLPTPIGGALLVGTNELIHVDQGGRTNGVAVNMFAKQCSSFGLADQSNLEMRLEGCLIEQLSNASGEMLIFLHCGELAILSFRLDGRSVSGLSVRRVSSDAGGSVIPAGSSSASQIGSNAYFVGSEKADSVVLGWNRKTAQLSRRKSKIDPSLGPEDVDEDEDDDDDDDLYGEGTSSKKIFTNGATSMDNSKAGDFTFAVHDSLVNIAPMTDITVGSSSTFSKSDEDKVNAGGVRSDLELVGIAGRDKAGSLAVVHRNIQPTIIGRFDFPEARGIWTMSAKRPDSKATKPDDDIEMNEGAYAHYDRLMIVSKVTEDASEESDVYALNETGFEALVGTEFEPAAGSTIEAGTLGDGNRIIQVLKSEVRIYDGDLGLAQILPMYDDDTGAEPDIISASFADPFILLLRDDSSIFVAQCDDNNELEEIEREDDALLATKWLAGCLYTDSTAVFSENEPNSGSKSGSNVKMFLLSAGGALHIYALPNLSKAIYVAEGLCFVPPVLSADYAARRSAARETLTEVLVADLGDAISKSPYLILRPSSDDLTIYEPFRTDSAGKPLSLSSALHFLKSPNSHMAENPEVAAEEEQEDSSQDTRDKPMRAVSNIGGYSSVFLPGSSPSFIIKSSKSTPRVISLQGAGVRSLSSFHTEGCDRGFIYIDVDGIARVSQLPSDVTYELGVQLQKVDIGQDIHALTYHPPMQSFVLGTSIQVPFELPKDDDHRRDWQKEDIPFKPTMEQSFLKLISPADWSVIDTVELEPCEMILCIKTLNLEVSETTNERKQLITIGTAISKGEDLPISGRVYVYDVVTVVPEPDRPETNKKLKLIAKEDIARGAITAVSEVGTQGFMLVAQGQKCMVRGLKEDGTLLPVAFMDMSCYVTSIKELRGTGLCVMSDAVKGVWFAGYTEDPYRMILFGKSTTKMEVVVADILPDGPNLYIVAADAECNLHVFQYDPEHPKTRGGNFLLHRTSFSLGGHMPTTMSLLPRTTSTNLLPATEEGMDIAAEATIPEHEILITSQTGAISVLTPLSESSYRRLSTLANHLSSTLYHACGLNPRAYRVSSGRETQDGTVGGRTIVDGGLLMRWNELGSQRKAEVASRVGISVEDVRDDLLALMGGLGYL